MTVSLHDVRLELPIGIAEWERVPGKTQLVLVDIDLHTACPPDAPQNIAECMDYDALYRYIRDDLGKRGHTDLLETLAHEISSFCLERFPVESCRVRLRKPHVYNGAAVPAVEVTRGRSAETASSSN